MPLKPQQRSRTAGSRRGNRTLFREARFAHALYVLGTIFRSAKRRHDIRQIRDAQRTIELTQPIWVVFNRFLEELQRLVVVLFGDPVGNCQPTQVVVVCVEVSCGLSFGPLISACSNLGVIAPATPAATLSCRSKISASAPSKRAPEIRSRRCVDQLTANAQAVARLAHASLEDIAHPQFAPDLLYVHGAAFVGKARIARDHEQVPEAPQGLDDVFHDAVREVFLIGVIAHVLEGQHGNR
jgi:hypothetical protein